MNIKQIATVVAGLLLFSAGVAFSEETTVTGSVDLGVRIVEENKQSAKFLEYRDIDDGLYGSAVLDAFRNGYYLDLAGKNIGLDDQYYKLKGGKFGEFKYSLYYNEIPHNISFGAKTFYGGVGTNVLDYFATNRAKNTDAAYTPNIDTSTNTWSRFDYATKRKDYGAGLELSLNTPFYFLTNVSQMEKNGVQPLGAPSGVFVDKTGAQTSPFGNMVEMPAPVDYKSKTLYLESGYRTKDMQFALEGTLNSFENANDYLTWRNPYVTTEKLTEVNSLSPDSDYWKIAAQGTIKLPLNSALAVRGSYARLENSLDLLNTIASSTSGGAGTSPAYTQNTPLTVNRPTFDGDISYRTASLALTSRPIKPLDVKVYYNYLNKDNDSTRIEYANPSTGASTESELFGYEKHNTGIDIGYKLPLKTKLDVGYEYLKINRDERLDTDTTTDHIGRVQIKNSYLDWLTAKVKYQHLDRTSNFIDGNAGTSATDANYIRRFVRRFDATDKTQDAVKVGFDVEPAEHLNVGLEYAYKINDYDQTLLGRTKDKRHEVYFDVAYEIPGVAKLYGYYDFEHVEYRSFHRNVSAPTAAGAFDPSNTTTPASNYNWAEFLKDYNYSYGVAATVPVVKDRLDFVASWDYQKADGKAKFETDAPLATPLANIDNYDDMVKKTLNAKAICKVTKALNLTFGYWYENLEFIDAQYQGYQYVMNNTTSPNTYLTGALSDHDYEAHVGYIMASYRF